mgnify:FL=1
MWAKKKKKKKKKSVPWSYKMSTESQVTTLPPASFLTLKNFTSFCFNVLIYKRAIRVDFLHSALEEVIK